MAKTDKTSNITKLYPSKLNFRKTKSLVEAQLRRHLFSTGLAQQDVENYLHYWFMHIFQPLNL